MKQASKFLILISVLTLVAFATKKSGVDIGDKAPAFTLKNVDGTMVSLKDYEDKKGVLIVFTCNHCPFAKAYEQRIIDLHNNYKDKYPVIAINSNDSKKYPEDSYKGMQKRAKQKDYPFVYLHDESQAIAKAYGASKTPELFLAVKKGDSHVIKYIGAIDNNYEDGEKADKKFVEMAIAAVEAGKAPNPTKTKAVGCTIKWKAD